MIVTRLIGGLGNQLFQYAYGLFLAEQSDQELFIDDSAFEDYKLHALGIDNFAIRAKRLPSELTRQIPGRYRGTPRIVETAESIASRIGFIDHSRLRLRREKPFGFQQMYLRPAQGLYLDGYWQGEAFFPRMRDRLRSEFILKRPISSKSDDVAKQIADEESVAVHVRRGDYITNASAKAIYRSLDAQYYRSCIADLKQHAPDVKVFVFSNDIPWCQQHLDLGDSFTSVAHNDASTAYEDLFLMSQCRHAVIANSSFSWWGAFLSEDHSKRRVYYPDPWFNPNTLDGSAIGCASWIGERSLSDQQSMNVAA